MNFSVKEKIEGVLVRAQNASYEERLSLAEIDEQQMDVFLDAINTFKVDLSVLTSSIISFVSDCEEITWIDSKDINEQSRKDLSDLIASMADLHSTALRKYAYFKTTLDEKKIAEKEISGYKHSLDDLQECYEDLENVFFRLPSSSSDKLITDLLSGI